MAEGYCVVKREPVRNDSAEFIISPNEPTKIKCEKVSMVD